ncbi:hypothetical protein VNO78_15215 [Psophocarpus tetragonolobus]|uniref:Leucine-rich repeat-containing N-terminal plant-type domain-containing protein n=1 Tax=Psophocarpus tetragonolobus TaxID=3891 RepID=A0AAN9XJF6_PSOTE
MFMGHCLWHLFTLLCVILVYATPSLSIDVHRQDKTSLTSFKQWVQDPNRSLSSWGGSNCTSWSGITCDNTTGRVLSINLTRMNLSGQIHPSLCHLSSLNKIALSHNNFTSPLPECFGNLLNLRAIDLSHNRFHGDIPDSFMSLRHLIELVLSGNAGLGGPLPAWIGNFSTNLESLHLGFCSFTGGIPQSLLYLKSLKYLDLENNLLSGNLVDFQQPLVLLNLASNQFAGTLPCFAASLHSLTVLNLSNNSIVGALPACIASFQALTHLNLSGNHLKYRIYPRLVFSEKLLVLDLSNNALSGPIPSKIAETTEKLGLVLLDLSHNQFFGEIPVKITELKSLQALFLSHNLLSGEIPARIGNLTYLQVIDLSHNSLSGTIPFSIVGCFQLYALILNNNNLSGVIQPEFDALDILRILDISNNRFSGAIPLTLAGCKSLEIVDFSSNELSGSLNDAITKWSNLRYLSLAQNQFSGTLPSWLFTFDAIEAMDFSHNKFSGFIPDINFKGSLILNPGNDTVKEPLVAARKVQLRVSAVVSDSNQLSFTYDLSSMVGIDLSSNLLHGEIPKGLFGLAGLEYLNLSCNFLHGQLPGLQKMQSLKALDLSHNSLSGHIPGNISSLQDLSILNLSYNCFSGYVTRKQGYGRFPGAFAGNPDLCMEASSGECDDGRTQSAQGSSFREDRMDDPISVGIFFISAFVSFDFGVVVLFCSARARNYILQTMEGILSGHQLQECSLMITEQTCLRITGSNVMIPVTKGLKNTHNSDFIYNRVKISPAPFSMEKNRRLETSPQPLFIIQWGEGSAAGNKSDMWSSYGEILTLRIKL